jgi:hypothetical protein
VGKSGHCKSRGSNFFYGKGMKTEFFIQHGILSTVKRAEFVGDRISHIVLRDRWCNIFVLNVHTPSEEKSDDSKESFDKEDQVSHNIPKYQMKILLGDFNAKLGREDIFKLIIGNESLHQYSNDNGVRRLNFTASKNLVVKSSVFPHQNIHKYS